jgi:hypothetical protein
MGKTYNNNEIPGDTHVHDLIPAYIDMSLGETERVRVRAHLEDCVDCRADYVELQATRRMLQQMPVVPVPRAFTLTPDMVKGSRKTSLFGRIFAPRTAPTFASGAVVAFGLLLFLFVSSTLATNPSFSPTTTALESSAPADAMRNSSTSEADTQAGNTGPAMEPTTTTAAAAAPDDGTTAGKQSPTQPSEAAFQPPASADSTPLPAEGMGGEVQPGAENTPNTEITSSDTSSPTTTSLFFNPAPSPDAAGGAPLNPNTGSDTFTDTTTAQVPIVQKFDFFLAVEIGLLVLGLALAGAYLIARRS